MNSNLSQIIDRIKSEYKVEIFEEIYLNENTLASHIICHDTTIKAVFIKVENETIPTFKDRIFFAGNFITLSESGCYFYDDLEIFYYEVLGGHGGKKKSSYEKIAAAFNHIKNEYNSHIDTFCSPILSELTKFYLEILKYQYPLHNSIAWLNHYLLIRSLASKSTRYLTHSISWEKHLKLDEITNDGKHCDDRNFTFTF